MRFIGAALVLAALMLCIVSQGAGEEYLAVSDVVMSLDKSGDAFFQVDYTLDTFPRIYVLVLGCRHLEPHLEALFRSYEDVEVLRADPDNATLWARDAGRKNGEYYLYDSRPLGTKIARLTVRYPDSENTDTFYNITATPDVFCKA